MVKMGLHLNACTQDSAGHALHGASTCKPIMSEAAAQCSACSVFVCICEKPHLSMRQLQQLQTGTAPAAYLLSQYCTNTATQNPTATGVRCSLHGSTSAVPHQGRVYAAHPMKPC